MARKKKKTAKKSPLALDMPLTKLERRTAVESARVLNEFVEALKNEAMEKVDEGISHRYALDFEMIRDVLEAEKRVYGKVLAAGLSLGEKDDRLKVILTEGAKKEIQAYLKRIIDVISKRGRRLSSNLQRISNNGVFKDKSWSIVRKYLSYLAEEDRKFKILEHILTKCCVAFTELGLGEECDFCPATSRKHYKTKLEEWTAAHPSYERSPDANKADARTLATLSCISTTKTETVGVSLVTSTRALYEVTQDEHKVPLANPLYFYLSQKIHSQYKDPVLRLDFVFDCSSDVLRLLKGLNIVIYGKYIHAGIRRRQVKNLLDSWQTLFTEGALADIKRWFGRASSYSVDRWILQSKLVQDSTVCRVPWLMIEHVVSKARRVLAQVVGKPMDVLGQVGACWSEPEHFPSGSRDVLLFDKSNCKVTLESFKGYYSLYWDADCTVGVFVEIINDVIDIGSFRPSAMILICQDGREIRRKLDKKASVSMISQQLGSNVLSTLILQNEKVRLYYELCNIDASIDLDYAREARVAVLSRDKDISIVAELCEKTLRAYVSKDDFSELFGKRIEQVFN